MILANKKTVQIRLDEKVYHILFTLNCLLGLVLITDNACFDIILSFT